MKVFSNKPVHDWSSHAADATRYMAIAIDEFTENTNLTRKFPTALSEYKIL